MQQSNETEGANKLCKSGCGFYASKETGYCSKCYRDVLARQTASPALTASSTRVVETMPAADLGAPASTPAKAAPELAPATPASGSSAAAAAPLAAPSDASPAAASSAVSSSSGVASSVAAVAPSTPVSLTSSTAAAAPSTPAAASTPAAPTPAAAAPTPAAAAAAAAAATPATPAAGGSGGPPEQKNKSRCYLGTCKKKVGLTGFECRCGFVFCGAHRYADQHACTFDYKAHDRSILEKNNPKVQGDKLQKV